MKRRINDLRQLLQAYRDGTIKEKFDIDED
jgi:hypothetical protein